MRLVIAALVFIISTSAFAQQPQPTVQDQLYAACGQTNQQLAKMVDAGNAQVSKLSDDLARAQARIKELEKKPEEKK